MPQRTSDPRTRRTCQRLGQALIELIAEKPIEAITVQEVLGRARVGRSTFYLHYRDKNDLLFSQLEGFLEIFSVWLSAHRDGSRRVAAVEEIFEHVGGQNRMYRALAESGHLQDFFDLAQDAFARGIARRLRELGGAGRMSRGELAVRATALAGSLLALLRWWIDRGAKESPKAMDAMFHRMVLPWTEVDR
ncbi:MAG: TetR/AcrR family transcriptional regulator [Acidobacteriaceae bacterium]